jgi:hypothetical protein
MTRIDSSKIAIVSPLLLGTLALTPTIVHAAEAVAPETANNPVTTALSANPVPIAPAIGDRVNLAVDILDVKPTDPAFQSLQALSTKYNCATLSATQTLSREAFAGQIANCSQRLESLVAQQPTTVTSTELAQLKALTDAFTVELKALENRVRQVETRVAQAPPSTDNFSTTTKLVGEAIFALTDVFGSDLRTVPGSGTPSANAASNTIFGNRLRLNFRTTFDGKDLLITRFQSRNSNSFSAGTSYGTPMLRLGFEGSEENATNIHLLQYQKPLNSQTRVFVTLTGDELDSYVPNYNAELAPAGTGALSRFGRFNPIYRLSAEGTGIAVNHQFNPQFGVSLAYNVPRTATPGVANVSGVINPPTVANNPDAGGLFGGSNLLFSQLNFRPSANLGLGFIYARSYHSGGTAVAGNNGSLWANNPFNSTAAAIVPTSANHYSFLATSDLSPKVALSGWVGYSQANRELGGSGNADIWNYAATLAFKDVGNPGSTVGLVFGMPPKVTASSLGAVRTDRDTSFHIEAFYKYKVSNNLFITPGIVMITNPEHNSNNPTLYLGTIRTTFNF